MDSPISFLPGRNHYRLSWQLVPTQRAYQKRFDPNLWICHDFQVDDFVVGVEIAVLQCFYAPSPQIRVALLERLVDITLTPGNANRHVFLWTLLRQEDSSWACPNGGRPRATFSPRGQPMGRISIKTHFLMFWGMGDAPRTPGMNLCQPPPPRGPTGFRRGLVLWISCTSVHHQVWAVLKPLTHLFWGGFPSADSSINFDLNPWP